MIRTLSILFPLLLLVGFCGCAKTEAGRPKGEGPASKAQPNVTPAKEAKSPAVKSSPSNSHDWVTIHSKAGRCAATFPNEPYYAILDGEMPGYAYENADRTLRAQILWWDARRVGKNASPLEALTTWVRNEPGRTTHNQKDVKVGGHAGRRFEWTSDRSNGSESGTTLVLPAENHFYIITIAGREKPAAEIVTKFMDSFVITDDPPANARKSVVVDCLGWRVRFPQEPTYGHQRTKESHRHIWSAKTGNNETFTMGIYEPVSMVWTEETVEQLVKTVLNTKANGKAEKTTFHKLPAWLVQFTHMDKAQYFGYVFLSRNAIYLPNFECPVGSDGPAAKQRRDDFFASFSRHIVAVSPEDAQTLVEACGKALLSEVVEHLGKAGHANVRNDKGITPLYRACEANRGDVILVLIHGANADPNLPNTDGMTPLHQACLQDNPLLVQMLIRNGANLKIANNSKDTPFAVWKRVRKLPDAVTESEFPAMIRKEVQQEINKNLLGAVVLKLEAVQLARKNQLDEWARQPLRVKYRATINSENQFNFNDKAAWDRAMGEREVMRKAVFPNPVHQEWRVEEYLPGGKFAEDGKVPREEIDRLLSHAEAAILRALIMADLAFGRESPEFGSAVRFVQKEFGLNIPVK